MTRRARASRLDGPTYVRDRAALLLWLAGLLLSLPGS